MALGKFAWRNRAAIKRTAQRFIKKRKRSTAKRSFGSRKKSKFRASILPGPSAYTNTDVKTLAFDVIDSPGQGLGTTERLQEQIYLKGIKICLNIINRAPHPLEVHFALVQLPSSNTAFGDNIKQAFFRADSIGDAVTMDFVDQSTEPFWDIRYLCNALNRDNKRIITHRKWILGEATTDPAQRDEHFTYYRKMEKYFPIKRVQQFRDGNDNVAERPYAWCMWAMPINDTDYGGTPGDQSWKYNIRVKQYFGPTR